jgi:hypothetical protein
MDEALAALQISMPSQRRQQQETGRLLLILD